MGSRKKRSSGEGHVRERADGLWEARLPVPGRSPRSFYGRTEGEALAKRNQARRDLEDGYSVDSRSQKLADYLTGWIDGPLLHSVSPNTRVDYRWVCEAQIIPEIGHIRLAALTSDDLDAFYYRKLRRGVGASTVNKAHKVLSVALRRAARKGIIPFSPTTNAEPPPVPKSAHKTLTFGQLTAFLRAAGGSRYEALFVIAGLTGMRPGELLGLKWPDLSLPDAPGEPGTIHIRRTLTELREARDYGRRLFLRETTKTGVGRSIHLLPQAVVTLKNHRVKQLKERLRRGSAWEEHDLVFPNLSGAFTERTNLVHDHFKPILREAGLPDIRFYDLRHTFATLWLESGEPIKVLQEILGHSRIFITMDRYSHVLPHMQTASMERWGSRLSSGDK